MQPPVARRAPIQVKRPGAITERNPVAVVVLTVCTCGIYYLWWLYTTGSELKDALDDPDINPGTDLLLTVFTCFLWSIFVEYRNSQKVYAALLSRDPYTKDQSEMVMLLNVAGYVVGLTWIIGTYILQEELNKLSRY